VAKWDAAGHHGYLTVNEVLDSGRGSWRGEQQHRVVEPGGQRPGDRVGRPVAGYRGDHHDVLVAEGAQAVEQQSVDVRIRQHPAAWHAMQKSDRL